MKPPTLVALVVLSSVGAFSCEEGKYDKYLSQPEASAAAPASPLPPPPPAPAPSASTTWKRKSATDCKPHPATIDFEDNAALEAEVRRKLGKDKAPITPADLAQVRSLNLTSTQTRQIEPCIFPMFTSLKDLYFGPSDFDDLLPIQKLPLETLVVGSSPVKDLHPIEGLKRLDRLDLSHTLVDDNSLKIVGGLVNLTELTLDEDTITDLTPLSNLSKLQKLSIKRTTVKNLAPLAGLRTLKALNIAETPVTDISPVQPLMSGGMKLLQK